jgi:hypothetical protein
MNATTSFLEHKVSSRFTDFENTLGKQVADLEQPPPKIEVEIPSSVRAYMDNMDKVTSLGVKVIIAMTALTLTSVVLSLWSVAMQLS